MAIGDNQERANRRKAAAKLADLMDKYGISPARAAREAGIYPATVQSLRETAPHLDTITRLSKYLEEQIRRRSAT